MARLKFSWVSDIDEYQVPIYMARQYQALFANHDCSERRVLKFTANEQCAYLPILIKEIGDGRKEAYSAYGYGGLLSKFSLSNADVEDLCKFLCGDSIVALFIRHSPFLNNQIYWPNQLIEMNRHTYVTNLHVNESFESYLKKIPQKLRWSVNYSRRAGLEATFRSLLTSSEDQVNIFYKHYSELMKKKKTSDYYCFTEKFFTEHAKALGGNCELAEILDPKSGDFLAGAFFLHDDTGWIHYHLSAATKDAMKLQSMELLLASAIYRYGNLGYRFMHLGGGHALDETDGLSRFKSKFSDDRVDFFCSKLICDLDSYEFERKRLPLKTPQFFLISDARNA